MWSRRTDEKYEHDVDQFMTHNVIRRLESTVALWLVHNTPDWVTPVAALTTGSLHCVRGQETVNPIQGGVEILLITMEMGNKHQLIG